MAGMPVKPGNSEGIDALGAWPLPSNSEFRIRDMKPIDAQPVLIDQAYERLVEAIADGTLAPGQRIRQEELAAMLGVSRQPVSHALQLLKRQRLVEETGKRGLAVTL